MAHFNPAGVLLAGLHNRCHSLGAQLDLLRVREFPTPLPVKLIEILRESLSSIQQNIDEAHANLVADESTDDIRSDFAPYHTFLESVGGFWLPWLSQSTTESLPHEILPAVESIGDGLIPNSEIGINALSALNYAQREVGRLLRNTLSVLGLEKTLDKVKLRPFIHLYSVSATPPSGALSHCLIGHEMGHSVFAEKGVWKNLKQSIQISKAAVERTVKANRLDPAKLPPDQLFIAQFEELYTYFLRITIEQHTAAWVEELFSDAVAVLLFGPAAISAYSDLVSAEDEPTRPGEIHPPSSMRIQFMYRILVQSDPGLGFKSLWRSRPSNQPQHMPVAIGHFEMQKTLWERYLDMPPIEAQSQEFEEVAKIVKSAERHIIKAALDNVPALVATLSMDIPPSQNIFEEFDGSLKKSVEFAPPLPAIINAGWSEYIRRYSNPSSDQHIGSISGNKLSRFDGWIRKAIEDAHLIERWMDSV